MNTLWTVLETTITPKTLRIFADRLEREMEFSHIGQEVPKIELKDWDNKTNIVLVADQYAWHKRDEGKWK